MAKSKQAKAAKIQEETFQQPTPPAQELSDEGSDVEFVTNAELEKDHAEEELERLVFGDGEGFRDGLRDFKLDDDEADEDGDESGSQGGLEGMDDADVCSLGWSATGSDERLTFCSCSFQTWHRQRTHTKHPKSRTRTNRAQNYLQPGRIVMTNVS